MDVSNIFGKMRDMQAKLKEAQDNLEHIQVTSEAGAGMVKATVNGKKKLLRLEVEPDLVKVEDKEMMQDLIVAAINKALEEAEIRAQEELRTSTAGMMPNIPGLDLSKMF
jgi:DNA-binding YbaB/EbfC family protein